MRPTGYLTGLKGSSQSRLKVTLLFLSLLMVLTVNCNLRVGDGKKRNQNGKKPVTAPVLLQTVDRGDISSYLRLNANLEPANEVDVFSRTLGTVVELKVEEGDEVRSGQLLARLDDSEQQLSVARAEAAVDKETAAYERAKELFDNQMLSEDEFDRVRSSLRDARLVLEQSRLTLTYTRITAPITGTVSVRNVGLGDRVDVTRPLFHIVDRSFYQINGWVSEADLPHLRIGMVAEVRPASMPDDSIPAVLVRISPVVDPTFGKVKATFRISKPPPHLKPGQFVEVRLALETHLNVPLIPKQALVYEAGRPVVYIYQDSLALRRPVEIGLQTGEAVELISGPEPGEQVITEGQTTIHDSARVRPITPTR
mgnify:CR=1 FL=1